jgi:hypothetical protein
MISVSSLNLDGDTLFLCENDDAYELRLSMKTDVGILVIRNHIESYKLVAWGKDHIKHYLIILIDDMRHKLFHDAYQTHGQGD